MGRWSERKKKEKEEEKKEMTLSLYECLRAAGLQHHYDRFTSAGVCHTAHLSVLTMEDYPLLGICTMEDRTQFFQLVKLIKTLGYHDDDDYDYSFNGCDESNTLVDRSFCHDSYETSDDKRVNGAAVGNLTATPSQIHRLLDFSNETNDQYQLLSHPIIHVTKYDESVLGKGVATSEEHHYKIESKSAKPVGHKHRKGTTRKQHIFTEMGTDGCMPKPTPVYEAKRAAGYNYGLPLSAPPTQCKNTRQLQEQRINVCVRKRPLTCAERRRGEADVVTTPGGESVIVHEGKEAVDLSQYILQHKFYFDQVFGEESSNEEVYRRTAHPLVQHMLKGGKVTCFAYGQTGAGKTHTMLGSSTRPGLYALAVQEIFAHLSATHSSQLVYISFFEIYCGQLYDLLDHRKRLFAREDGEKVVHISGLRDVRVDSVSSLLQVISQGTIERTQGMSGVNPLSSRSHALLQIHLRDPDQKITGRMWFVDLAGSERASDAKEPDRQSRMEGAEINQSLLALKECIRSLDKEQSYIPFRQSKLTQVLKDSFVGDSMTCMIANISPGHTATEHTLNTLRYADRVKELRRQVGLRGRRRNRSKTVPSPKHNVFNINNTGSSVGSRGKSPPKKPKLTRQSKAFGPANPTTGLAMGSTFLCSTPKNSKSGDGTNDRRRKEIGLEHITPVRGWLRMGDKSYGNNGTEHERHENIERLFVSEQNPRAVLVLGQPKDKQLHSLKVQKEKIAHKAELSFKGKSGFGCREEENKQHSLKVGIESARESRDTNSNAERLWQRELTKANERDKERERHLRQYHRQLQQFMPSSASSSIHHFSSSAYSSSCSSAQGALFHLSRSANMCYGLEEDFDGYTTRFEVRADGNRGQLRSPSSEIQLQTETSSVYNNINEENAHGVSGCVRGVWKAALEGREERFEQEMGQSENRRSLEATGDETQRRKERRPAGIDGGERKLAWKANKTADVISKNFEAQLTHSCDSQDIVEAGVTGPDILDNPADGVWSAGKGGSTDMGHVLSANNNSDGNSLVIHPSFESPHQRAPAERPLSPACEHTNTLLTPGVLSNVSLESKHTRCNANISETAPSNSHRVKELWLTADASKRCFSHAQSAVLPPTTRGYKIPPEPFDKQPVNPSYTQVPSHSENKSSVLPQNEVQTDYFSFIADPLSIFQLQVDQEAATVSFLQGDKSNTSLCPLKNKSGEDSKWEEVENVVEGEDVEFQLSFLESPQAKIHHPPILDTTNHTEGKQDIKLHNSYIGIPEVILGSLHNQESNHKQTPAAPVNKPPISPLNKSACASMQTSSPSLHNLITDDTQVPLEYNYHKTTLSSTITPPLETVSGYTLPSQCHTVHLKHFSNSTISLQPSNLAKSNGQKSTINQQVRPTSHLFNLDNLDHAKWCIFEAHWEQLKEMATLCRTEGKLLCQQPDMTFGEYVHKLEEIMAKKAQCIHSMRAQLQPHLKPIPSNHPPGADNPIS